MEDSGLSEDAEFDKLFPHACMVDGVNQFESATLTIVDAYHFSVDGGRGVPALRCG